MVTRFPDPVAEMVKYLSGASLGVPVASQVPNPSPSTFVVVGQTGGDSLDPAHEMATLSIQVWSDVSEAETNSLARDIAAYIRSLPVCLECNVPYSFPVPRSDKFRQQMTARIILRPERI